MRDREKGYKSWKVRYYEGKPELYSVVRGTRWSPGGSEKEFKSDWSPETDEPFESTSKGIYSKKGIKELREEGLLGDVVGEIQHLGKTSESGTGGRRSEKARISTLLSNIPSCFACGKDRPSTLITTRSGHSYPLCSTCRKNLNDLIEKFGLSEEVGWDELLKRLAEEYDAEIEERLE